MRQRLIYVNGAFLPEQGAHLSALDRGFTLGDGVFETLRAVGGRIFRWDDHLARLHRSAATVGLPLPGSPAELSDAISALLGENRLTDALVRITVSRGVPDERGLMPPSTPTPTLAIQAAPFAGYPEERYRRGFTATISAIRRNEHSPLSYVKSCNYLDSVLARMGAAARGADEALLLNTAGQLACGASSNIFLVSGGTLVTPSLGCGVLDGVTRRTVAEIAADLRLQLFEREIAASEIFLAEELFITNTALGVMPLVAVDGQPIGRGVPGPVASRLRAAYAEILLCHG